MLTQLRPYQKEAARAVLESVFQSQGRTFTVEIARQGGKNELSAQLELLLLCWFAGESKNLVKCSPTFKPQTVVSMMRLKEKLNAAGLEDFWTSEMGYMIRLGDCRCIFLSAEKGASVVGNTAHLLLEVDEAQDVDEEKYTKEFKPMGSTTNVTNVLWGTTWDDSTLLEKMKQTNLELERKDGIKRHFRYDWQEVAKYNPAYLAYVEGERQRLGEEHPLFRTQYRLLTVRGGGGFLDRSRMALLQGDHSRRPGPETGKVYVAGIDLAGEAEAAEDELLKSINPRQDSTVITIGEIETAGKESRPSGQNPAGLPVPGALFSGANPSNPPGGGAGPLPPVANPSGQKIQTADPPGGGAGSLPSSPFSLLPKIRVVQHYSFTGEKHAALYPRMVEILKNLWHCRRVVVDATGVGQPVASFLKEALGTRVVPFTFTAQSKSRLGFNLLAAVNSGGLKMYAGDSSPEYREFWRQIEKAKGYYRASQTMNFFVDPSDGHDDYLMSLALLVEAAQTYTPREAKGR